MLGIYHKCTANPKSCFQELNKEVVFRRICPEEANLK